jgi:tetratricopeptide (TPR) repeat protein
MNIIPCTGFALVALGRLHIAKALAGQEKDSDSPGIVKQQGDASYTRLLKLAWTALQRALALEGLEAETRTEGQLALAQASFLLGEIDTARQQAMQSMEEARRLEQTWLLACARRLMGEMLSAQGRQEEAKTYFEQALETLQKCGMRLEWARTLQSYGATLLGELGKDDGSYRQGLKYLEEAREVFRECNAVLDLRGVEGVIDRYTVGVAKKGR